MEIIISFVNGALHEHRPYLDFSFSAFSDNCTEYGDIQSKSLYSVQMQENRDQKNSEYGQFLSSWEWSLEKSDKFPFFYRFKKVFNSFMTEVLII